MRTLVFLALAGCGTGLSEFGPDTADTSVEAGDVVIDAVSPWWGPTAGGTLLTISGTGFTEVQSVSIGDVPVDFFREDAETLFVTSPPVTAEGPAAVVIETGGGTARSPEGYWYSNNGPPNTGDPDPDPDTGGGGGTVTPTGQIGGLVELTLVQIACPECFAASQSLIVAGAAAFHQPSPTSWNAWLPPSGTCALNPPQTGPNTARMDVGEWVYLESGSSSIPMRRTSGASGVLYEAPNLTESDYLRNASYDVNVPGTGGSGAFRVTGGMQSTQGFDSVTPFEMLYVDPFSAFAAPVSQQGQLFTWAPSGGSGNFLIRLDVYTSDGAALAGSVVCFGPDNGQMVVPGAYLAGLPSYGLVAIQMYRYRTSETVIPTSGHTLQSIAQFGVWGTGTLVPF